MEITIPSHLGLYSHHMVTDVFATEDHYSHTSWKKQSADAVEELSLLERIHPRSQKVISLTTQTLTEDDKQFSVIIR